MVTEDSLNYASYSRFRINDSNIDIDAMFGTGKSYVAQLNRDTDK